MMVGELKYSSISKSYARNKFENVSSLYKRARGAPGRAHQKKQAGTHDEEPAPELCHEGGVELAPVHEDEELGDPQAGEDQQARERRVGPPLPRYTRMFQYLCWH